MVRASVRPRSLGLGRGKTDETNSRTVKQALAGVTVSVGAAGQVLAGYAQQEVGTDDATKKVSLGYRHNPVEAHSSCTPT